MIKRMTLLRRRPDLPEAAFRQHWAEPHAAIAKGFEGIARYNQNRVASVCWQTGGAPWAVDGIVELWFTSQETVNRNATSATTQALIEDEPRFLSGLTALSIGECPVSDDPATLTKYMVLAKAPDVAGLGTALETALRPFADRDTVRLALDPLAPFFTRAALAFEADPPNVSVTLWATPEAAEALVTGAQAALRPVFGSAATCAVAYAIDPLRIV